MAGLPVARPDTSVSAARIARAHGPCLALLFVFPLALMALNDSWTFLVPSGWVDPYYYKGLYISLSGQLNAVADWYPASRLPGLLLGAAVHGLFAPRAAEIVLRLLFFYACTLNLYAIVVMLWRDRLAALVAALLLGANTSFLWAIGWDYFDGPAAAGMLATLACLTSAARSTSPAWRLFAAGVLAEVVVSTNVFLVVVLPLFALWYFLIRRVPGGRLVEPALLYAFAGFGAAVVAFGLVNFYLTGLFNYLQPQISYIFRYDDSVWEKEPLHAAGWLVFPFLAGVLSVPLLAYSAVKERRGDSTERERYAASAALVMLASLALFTILHLRIMAVYQYSEYGNILIPFAFVVFAAVLGIALSGATRTGAATALAGGGVALVLVAPFAISGLRFLPECPGDCLATGASVAVVLAALLLSTAAMMLRSAPAAVAALCALSLLNVGTADRRIFIFANQQRAAMRARAMMAYDANAIVRQRDPAYTMLFWFDGSEAYGPVYTGLAAMNLRNMRMISAEFPEYRVSTGTSFARRGVSNLRPGDTIAIPTVYSEESVVAAANRRLFREGLHVQPKDRATIRRGAEAFSLYFVEVAAGARGAEPLLVRLNLRDATTANGATIAPLEEGVRIATASQPWAYAAVLPLAGVVSGARGGGVLEVRGTVRSGRSGIGVLRADQRDFVARAEAASAGDGVLARLRVASFADTSQLVVQTWSDPAAATLDITAVTLSLDR